MSIPTNKSVCKKITHKRNTTIAHTDCKGWWAEIKLKFYLGGDWRMLCCEKKTTTNKAKVSSDSKEKNYNQEGF